MSEISRILEDLPPRKDAVNEQERQKINLAGAVAFGLWYHGNPDEEIRKAVKETLQGK